MIQVSHLSLRAGDFHVREVNLEIAPQEYFVLLGPTGSGKTLLLKCLCGLVRALSGTVRINGQDVTHLEPRRRRIGYVPQDCGLFPHMDVARNIAFPLRARGSSQRDALRQIMPFAEALRVRGLLDRSPVGLSGGERQKVAVARALAGRPDLLLLDEPVSALDEPSRKEACAELRRVQRQFGIATIHVCHSTEEAFTVSDRAGVLCGGRLVQAGTMEKLVRRPRNETVARLLHAENIFSGRAAPSDDGATLVSFAGGEIRVPGSHQGDLKLTARPEALRVLPDGANAPNTVRALLTRVDYRGSHWHLEFDAQARIVVHLRPDMVGGGLAAGRHYAVQFPLDAVHVLEG